MNIWLYHINPARGSWSYQWDVHNPHELLRNPTKDWPAPVVYKKVKPGDMICVFLKNLKGRKDGVYACGTVTGVGEQGDERWFSWSIDAEASKRLVSTPIGRDKITRFFPRSYGATMQRLDEDYHKEWLSLIKSPQTP